MNFEFKSTFEKTLEQGINFFLGAGFSVLGRDMTGNPLPVGIDLKNELIRHFSIPESEKLELGKICTILEHNRKRDFYAYIKNRFKVIDYDKKYLCLDKFNIKTIFTTNVDNLLYKIFSVSKNHYLNDINLRGPSHGDRSAIDVVTLHGSILDDERPMFFGTLDISSAFHSDPDRWHYLTKRFQDFPTIFWGHSLEDAGVLHALNPKTIHDRPHKDKWIILRENPDEGTIRYLKAMNMNIIVADTIQMLDYLHKLGIDAKKISGFSTSTISKTRDLFPTESIPDIGSVPVRPIVHFYLGAPPEWNDIFSKQIHRTSHFYNLREIINSGKNVVVIGLPACGKTTLLMQTAAEITFNGHKLVCESITEEKANLITNRLDGQKALIFIDNFVDSIEAFNKLAGLQNIIIVGFDREYNFDIISHKIHKENFEIIDVTELIESDIQTMLSKIPENIKSPYYRKPSTEKGVTPSLFEVIQSNISSQSITKRFLSVIHELEEKDPKLVDLLVVCCYVHKCRTPVSLDMLISFFRDKGTNYQDIYQMCGTLGAMLTDYVGDFVDTEQDHYVPRSIIISEAILEQTPAAILKRVLERFFTQVSPSRICRFDIFRRRAFDADIIDKAFLKYEEGRDFYDFLYKQDNSPYLRQHGALYLAHKKRFKEAFAWIDEAVMKSGGNIPSIRNSHAIILFKANINSDKNDPTVKDTLKRSMDILKECYNYDKRKTYHALTFADQALQYSEAYSDENVIEYLQTAKNWLEEEAKNSYWNRNIKRLHKSIIKRLEQMS